MIIRRKHTADEYDPLYYARKQAWNEERFRRANHRVRAMDAFLKSRGWELRAGLWHEPITGQALGFRQAYAREVARWAR